MLRKIRDRPIAIGFPITVLHEKAHLLHCIEARGETRRVVRCIYALRMDDERVHVRKELVAVVVQTRDHLRETRIANVVFATAGLLRLPEILNAEPTVEIPSDSGPILDPERGCGDVRGLELRQFGENGVSASLRPEPKIVGPGRRLRRSPDQIAELPKKLRVGGTLYLAGSLVDELPKRLRKEARVQW